MGDYKIYNRCPALQHNSCCQQSLQNIFYVQTICGIQGWGSSNVLKAVLLRHWWLNLLFSWFDSKNDNVIGPTAVMGFREIASKHMHDHPKIRSCTVLALCLHSLATAWSWIKTFSALTILHIIKMTLVSTALKANQHFH